MATIHGTTRNDVLNGTHGDDTISGSEQHHGEFGHPTYSGDDTLRGGAGNDHLDGEGLGYDTLGSSDDRLEGGDGDDSLRSRRGVDTLDGGNGEDYAAITRTTTADLSFTVLDPTAVTTLVGDGTTVVNVERFYIITGDGDDTIATAGWDDWLRAEAGDDVLHGNGGADTLDGGSGRDTLRGGAGSDHLFGGANDDLLDGGAGADRLFGGAGWDAAIYWNATEGVNAHLAETDRNTGEAAGDIYRSVEALQGSVHDDHLGGDANSNALHGNAGDDFLSGNDGDDFLYGESGNDTIFSGKGRDIVSGGSGHDSFYVHHGEGSDHLDGGAGHDHAHLSLSGPDGVSFVLRHSSRQTTVVGEGTTLIGIESVTFRAGERDDLLVTRSGKDGLDGGGGDDTLAAGGGDDWLDGGAGDDVLNGGAGDDDLTGDVGNDRVFGGGGNDRISDRMWASGQPPVIEGGNDRQFGGAGNDTLEAGSGRDTLDGGAGDDVLYGSSLAYGTPDGERDVLVFRGGFGSDQVHGFEDGIDRMVFVGFDEGSVSVVRSGDDVRIEATSGAETHSVTLLGFSGTLDGSDYVLL